MVNRLAASPSLYLRKHAENPVDWWPWGEAALQQAVAENKPIFLSIGYSSCHWCTVMEGEAFSDPAVAAYMNANFLPIKVDREERPDLDSIYMQALQMLTGQGGWPLNVFLTPETLVPFYGGTYFPVEPKYGRPGFLRILTALREFYDSDKAKLGVITQQVLGNLQQGTALPAGPSSPGLDQLHQGIGVSAEILRPTGQGTCFPMMPYGETALRGVQGPTSSLDSSIEVQPICAQRGLDLALGGIYDQVGGGFHRYTVDPNWTVPHFEKMLYDNGQIVEYLAHLWASGQQEPAFERVIAGTVAWLQREMTAPQGYFYAAQDADSFVTASDVEPEEGAFYVWDYATLQATLTAEQFEALSAAFTITPAGNFEGQIVLQRTHPGPLATQAIAALQHLFSQRYGASPQDLTTFPPAPDNQVAKGHAWPGRIPPVTDTKLIVAWNSLIISGLAAAAIALNQPDYLSPAVDAAQYIVQHQWSTDRLQRLNYDGQPQGMAQSEDYALWIKALLDLHQAALVFPTIAAGTDWLALAIATQQTFHQGFWSHDQGGYFNTARDRHQGLLVQERAYQDNATPSANGIAIANLCRLALLTDDLTYHDQAAQALQAFSPVMAQLPQACPSLFSALDWFLHGTLVQTTADMVSVLASDYRPTTVFVLTPELPQGAVGLVCRGMSCLEPAQSLEQLRQQLSSC
ncbi:MAG: thioredoxin domain-containing protein [Leptolyngbya sp. LCM1.Bin17]|nr:MAG: thioredoxin domain-containing protein [Leptolyngbya sp. LCM1.Bin17]